MLADRQRSTPVRRQSWVTGSEMKPVLWRKVQMQAVAGQPVQLEATEKQYWCIQNTGFEKPW
jgi:hypothetical protein